MADFTRGPVFINRPKLPQKSNKPDLLEITRPITLYQFSVVQGDGSASGDATASGVGASLSAGAGSASGDSTASGAGSSSEFPRLNRYLDQLKYRRFPIRTRDVFESYRPLPISILVKSPADGTASGDATATGVGASLSISTGTASGDATASGIGADLTKATGSASGDATASAVGASLGKTAGTASGDATASATGISTTAAAGSASGDATASATGISTAKAAGSASGDAIASGESSAGTASSGAGSASGDATASAVGISLADASGSASGDAIASAEGFALSEQAPAETPPVLTPGGAGAVGAWNAWYKSTQRRKKRKVEDEPFVVEAAIAAKDEADDRLAALMQERDVLLAHLTELEFARYRAAAIADVRQAAAELERARELEDEDEAMVWLMAA